MAIEKVGPYSHVDITESQTIWKQAHDTSPMQGK